MNLFPPGRYCASLIGLAAALTVIISGGRGEEFSTTAFLEPLPSEVAQERDRQEASQEPSVDMSQKAPAEMRVAVEEGDWVSIRVQVCDDRGQRLSGLWVGARLGKRTELWPRVPMREHFLSLARSDENGTAMLKRLPRSNAFEIGVWGKGWALQSFHVGRGELDSTNIDGCEFHSYHFRMQRGRDVDLQVVDLRGIPVEGAEVRLQVGDASRFAGGCVIDFWGPTKPNINEAGQIQGYAQRTRTDANGRIQFASVPFGAGEIRWRHRSYINSGDLRLNAFVRTTTVHADPGVIVHPRILKADGTPLRGGRVMMASQVDEPDRIPEPITGSRDILYDEWVDAVVDSDDGSIELTGVKPNGWYYLQVEYWGVLFDTPWRHASDRSPVIQLPPFHEIRGRFRPVGRVPEFFYTELSTKLDLPNLAIEIPTGDEILPRSNGEFVFIVDPQQTQVDLTMPWTDVVTYHKSIDVGGDVDLGVIDLPPKNWQRTDWVDDSTNESDLLIH